jgi:RNA polymerase sigma-70 factor (ECF subfamily)
VSPTDPELVQRCLAGDERAYRELIERYERQVYSVAMRMVRVSEDAEDLTQETFVRMFKALDRYDPARPFPAWLFTIAARLSIDQLRRRRVKTVSLFRSEPGSDEERVVEFADPGPGPEELAERREEQQSADRLIGSLPEHYRIVVVLRHHQGLSYEEISEALRLPLGTVKARIHRARALLKERLEAGS